MVMFLDGRPTKEIAERVSLKAQTVRKVINTRLFSQELERRKKELTAQMSQTPSDILDDVSKEAVETLVRMMKVGSNEQVKLKAATEILDRAGIVKVDKSIIMSSRASAEEVIKLLNKEPKPRTVVDVTASLPTGDETEHEEVDSGPVDAGPGQDGVDPGRSGSPEPDQTLPERQMAEVPDPGVDGESPLGSPEVQEDDADVADVVSPPMACHVP
jgi:hypothetical protein